MPTRLTSDAEESTDIRIEQYNDLRKEAGASSYLLAFAYSAASLSIQVAAGKIWFDDDFVEYDGGDSPVFSAPAANDRIDILSINESGVLVRTAGTENVSPVAPDIPLNNIPTAQIYNRPAQTSIEDEDDSTNGYIQKDLRPFLKSYEPTQTDQTSSRSLDTTYTNGRKWRVVMATVEIVRTASTAGTSGQATAKIHASANPPSTQVANVFSGGNPGVVGHTMNAELVFFVPPEWNYRIDKTELNTGTVVKVKWFEADLPFPMI